MGITIVKKLGHEVADGDLLAEVRYTDPARLAAATPLIDGAWRIGDEPPAPRPMTLGEIRPNTST